MNDRCTTVVIVTYWSQATIDTCLTALLASSLALDVVVVDNGSGDGTRADVQGFITAGHPVRLIGNDDNPGFGAACNQGAALASGDVVLFLNPDAFLQSDTISRLRAVLDADASWGLLGCHVVDEDGKTYGPQRRREPTWRRSLVSAVGLATLERRWPWLEGVEVPASVRPTSETGPSAGVEAVDAVNGSTLMLPLAVFRELGGFDEAFRLHAEDLDLCRRVRDAGRRVGYVSSVAVTHIGGVSSRRHPFWVEWQKTRSLWRYFRKHESGASVPARVLVAFGLALRCAVKLPALALATLRHSSRP